MNRYVIDFETTFSKENTLITKSIEAYVRDPKFEVIGCGISYTGLRQNESDYIGNEWYETPPKWLDQHAVICHHAQFDCFILNHVYGIKPAYIFDTLSMARALYPRLPKHSLEYLVEYLALGTPKQVPYNLFRGKTLADIQATPGLEAQIAAGCLHDVELTAKLFDLLHSQMPQSELDLIDATVRLFTEPKLIGDMTILEECVEQAIYERENWPAKLGIAKENLLSDRKFATLLRGAGIEPPTKISPRTGKSTYALAKSDKSFTDLRSHEDANIRNLVEARIAVKTSIAETRSGRFLNAAQRGPLPVYLRYYGAHTGRFSGGDKFNFQNLPRNSRLRNGICAPDGHTLVWADFSQIEARVLACLAGCTKLRDAFAEGRDIYSEFGTSLFRVEVSKSVQPEFRYLAKKTILGSGYGLGPEKFMKTVNTDAANNPEFAGFQVDMELAQKAIRAYRDEYPDITLLWKSLDNLLHTIKRGAKSTWRHEYTNGLYVYKQKIILPNKLSLDYTGIEHDGESFRLGTQKLWGGSLTENIVQALARIIMTDAWLNIKETWVGNIVLTVHDELVWCVPNKLVEAAKEVIQEIMVIPPTWMPDLPLAVEIKSGTHYGQENK